MAKTYSDHFKEKTGSSSGEEPLYLLEISHPQLADPIRVVRDTDNIDSNGNTFTAMGFDIQLPDDVDGKLPSAPVRIDNVGRELTQWLDATNGGKGATVRIMQVMRDDPDTLEADIEVDLMNVKVNGAFVLGNLGYEDTLNQPALAVQYRPDNTPGLF